MDESSIPICPQCGEAMRLLRIVPSMLPPKRGVEARVFTCKECETMVTRTARFS
jgi:hypothetical protein